MFIYYYILNNSIKISGEKLRFRDRYEGTINSLCYKFYDD